VCLLKASWENGCTRRASNQWNARETFLILEVTHFEELGVKNEMRAVERNLSRDYTRSEK
jgi:hypothetical protein